MIPYTAKINELLIPTPITNESHLIGIYGVATYNNLGQIRLVQVPQAPNPTSTVVIPGYTEIFSGTPTGTQFITNYVTGVITFSTSLEGTAVLVSYNGLGSEIAAEDINELQEPLNAIANLSITYNWPAAPTLVWTLASNLILDSNISSFASISLTKLQPLNPNIVPVTNGSGILISSSTTTTELSYLDATSSIQTQLNLKQSAGNYITALTGDITTSLFNLLDTASTYAVLGASTVTNTGLSVLTGDLGLNPGTSVVGFPPGTFSGVERIANSFAAQAQTDASSAYTELAALSYTTDLTGQVLGTGGVVPTLFPGVYKFTSTAQLTGTLTLDAQHNPNAQWVFQIGSALTTASASSVVIINGGNANNVYWLCGSSATLGTSTSLQGTIIATASIVDNGSSTVNGRLIALTGAVTLDDTTITVTIGTVGLEVATISPTAAVLSIHADSSPDLTGNVQLVSGTNITLNQVGQAITINAAAGGTGITALTGDVTTSSSNSTLLTSATYAVLGATTVTNTGSSVLTGDLGLNPGTSIVGFPPGSFSGTEQIANSFALQAQTDASAAYTTLAALPFTMDLTGQVLGTGGVIPSLVPGVYKFTSTAQLTGTLTLDAGGDPNAQWVFQVGSALTTASSSSVVIINGGSANNVYWLMGTSATLGTTTAFVGTIIATASITANTGASVTGRLLALTGSVTLSDNGIIVPAGSGGVEVATLATVNADIGTFTNATVTVNGKGLITAVSNGTVSPSIVAHVSLTGQNTDLGPVTLFTPASTGIYRASVYLATTTADVTAGTVTANIEWTDDAQTETASTSALSLIALGFVSSTFVIESFSGTPIKYSTTNTGFFNAAFYSVYIVIEKLS